MNIFERINEYRDIFGKLRGEILLIIKNSRPFLKTF